jgi:hypothetical protein
VKQTPNCNFPAPVFAPLDQPGVIVREKGKKKKTE